MSAITDLAKAFRIGGEPWVVQIYLKLLFGCALLMVGAMAFAPSDAATQVLAVSTDGFKVVLGACLGALSMVAHRQWGAQDREGSEDRGRANEGGDAN